MSVKYYNKCSIYLKIALLCTFIYLCTSAPVNVSENAYTQFISELNRNKCSVPHQVQLPFDTTKINNFEYLSSYLEICQKTESTKRNREAIVLCEEIFDNVRNISCPVETALPDIDVKLSKNVCKDIGALKDLVPENDKSLLKRLTDDFLCDIMCDSEFEKACQVLLWSFEVQKLIASVASPEESEPPNGLDVGDTNDNDKQENTIDEDNPSQISVNPENDKPNNAEEKDANENIIHNGVAEVPGVKQLKNIEQKPDGAAALIGDQKLEKPGSTIESNSGNLTVPKTESQDKFTGISKSTSSLKTSSTVSQQTPLTSNSNVETIPSELKKSDSNVQNINKLQAINTDLQAAGHDETNVGDLLSKNPNTEIGTQEQSQPGKADVTEDTQITNKIDTNKPHDELLQGISVKPIIPLIPKEGSNNEIVGEMSQRPDLNPNFFPQNELPHESEHEESPHDAAINLQENEQNLSNHVNTLAQNNLQDTVTDDDKLTKKSNSSTTVNQTIKDTTLHQTIQEISLDKTKITQEESKVEQTKPDSDLRKLETHDQTKADVITHVRKFDDGTTNTLTDQKKPKVSQQTEEFDNTIPDTTGISIDANEKLPEKVNSKSTAINLDDKSVPSSSLTETSTKTIATLEKMEGGSDLRQPADEEGDHYEGLENPDDDYPRTDYDGGLYEGSKNKESNPGVSSSIAKETIASQNEKPMEFPSRNSFGQDTSDIQMIGFPEQEDSHFFFYFLSIVLILMAGYLLFHNKQKIIALIVEGRHERNRRSHRVGYKKLETK